MTALLTPTPAPRRKAASSSVASIALTAAVAVAAKPAAPAVRPAPAPPDAASAAAQVMAVLPGVMDAMRHVMRAQLDSPLTVPQFRGLNFIDHHPGSSVSALAGFLGVTLATASAMADRLVRAGYLHSQGSTTDRRRTELQLCASGKAVLDRMRLQTQTALAGSLQACTPQQLSALVDGLAVLALAFPRIESL